MKQFKLLTGKGYKEYKSKKTQKKFAESLITIGNIFFIAGISPLLSLIINGFNNFNLHLLATAFGFTIGAMTRNYGLETLDIIELENNNKAH